MTANANRRKYGFVTAWLFHLVGNTLVLWFPEIFGRLRGVIVPRLPASCSVPVLERAASAIAAVSQRGRYAGYVAPLTVGYLASHPQFNIYKKPWSTYRVAGFGPDSIPHATTAFGFTRLVHETLVEIENQRVFDPLPELRRVARNHIPISLIALLAVTTLYESSELLIYRRETKVANGDRTRVNMEWSANDTLFDVLSNLLGWTAAWLIARRTR